MLQLAQTSQLEWKAHLVGRVSISANVSDPHRHFACAGLDLEAGFHRRRETAQALRKPGAFRRSNLPHGDLTGQCLPNLTRWRGGSLKTTAALFCTIKLRAARGFWWQRSQPPRWPARQPSWGPI